MPSAVKTYIFTEKGTDTVLLVKRSLRYAFMFDMPGLNSYLLSANEKFPVPQALTDAYAPMTGIKPAVPGASENTALLRKKVESAIFIRTACGMLMDEIRKSLSLQRMKTSEFRGEAFRSYFLLIREEKKIVLKRVQEFLANMEAKIAAADSGTAVEKIMQHFKDNVNLGVYSAANQERKKIDG